MNASSIQPHLNPGPFVGRNVELGVLEEAFARGQRLVTVTGMGGSGKTRLASVYATQSSSSVVWVDLSGVSRVEHAVSAVASALHGRQQISDMAGVGKALADLGPMLVVLDAFEHLAPLAGATVGSWLVQAPDLQFLATSRLPLGLAAEKIVLLNPLDREASVELLVARAKLVGVRKVREAQATLADVAGRLEGIPLAIELAAARLQTLSLGELQARLADRFSVLRTDQQDVVPRHAALKATLDWSWALLTPDEQATLAQCTVFRQGFTVEAAETVVALTGDASVLDVLQSLQAHGLVRLLREGERRVLVLLDVVREYASLHLSAEARERAEERHTEYYVSSMRGMVTPSALTRHLLDGLDPVPADQLDNLEAVVRRAGTKPTPRAEASLALFLLLEGSGPGPRIAQALIDAHTALRPEDGLLAARITLAVLRTSRSFGIALTAPLTLDEAYCRARDAGEGELAALILHHQGREAVLSGAVEEGAALYSEALALAHESGDPATIAQCIQGPAVHKFLVCAVPDKILPCAELVAVAEREAFRRMHYRWLANLAAPLFEAGRIAEAWSRAAEAAVLARARGDLKLLAGNLTNMSEIAVADDRISDARACLEEAAALSKTSFGVYDPLGSINRARAWLALAEGRLDDAEMALQGTQRVQRSQFSKLVESIAASGRGYAALLRGQSARAVDCLEAAAQDQGSYQRMTDRPLGLGFRAVARAALGDAEGARLDRQRARDEAARWDCHRFSVTLRLLDAAVDVELQVPRATERATALLVELENKRIVPYNEARIAGRVLERCFIKAARVTLRVGPLVQWIQVNTQPRVALKRSALFRRLLTTLLEGHASKPGTPVLTATLLEAGWPGDRSKVASLENRLWVALSKLRRLGLEDVLERVEGGYRVPPDVVVVWT